nr:GATA transcription factor 21-like [Tanacetum cinerariifolium]
MNDGNQVKWMSSKMRVMLKMKKTDPLKLNTFRSTTTELELEDHQDHKEPLSSPKEETTNSSSINSTSSNNNIQIRVCSDCNTTKTPLWRSGPRAVAAGETNKNVSSDKPTSLKATKVLLKDPKKTNIGHVTKYKKKQYSNQISTNLSPSSSPPKRKNCVEEFLVSLRKNLAIHGVFPQDEKEAAILLMALSCGYAHQ